MLDILISDILDGNVGSSIRLFEIENIESVRFADRRLFYTEFYASLMSSSALDR